MCHFRSKLTMNCFRIGRKTLIKAEGSPENRIDIRISAAPNCFEKKLELKGGDSEYVPINLLDAGSLISSIVQVVVFNGSGQILHTDTSLPRFLAPYQQIRIAVDSPFKVESDLARAGFWHNFIRLFSSFRFGNKTVNGRRRPIDIESQAAPNQSEGMSKDSSVLGFPMHNVCGQMDEEIDNKKAVSDAHCIDFSWGRFPFKGAGSVWGAGTTTKLTTCA